MNAKFKKLGSAAVLIFIGVIGLARCGFEGGAFSSVTIEIPDEIAMSSLTYSNDSNPYLDDVMGDYIHKIQTACWKTGWRSLVRGMLNTGPESIQLTVSDIVAGTRTTTIFCKNM